MCSTEIPKNLLSAKLDLLLEVHQYEQVLGAYNTREGTTRVFGTGLRGTVSKMDGLVGWSETEAGFAKLKQQAADAGLSYPRYLATQLTKWAAQRETAAKKVKMFEVELAAANEKLSAIDSANPLVRNLSIEDMQNLLGDTSGDDTNHAGARLAAEAASQSIGDAEIDALASRSS